MEDQRDKVIEAIRATLPEFCQRNGVELSEKAMDNLAHWTAGVVPSLTYRRPCQLIGTGIPCACPGYCSAWRSVDTDDFNAQEENDPIEPRRMGIVGGTWSASGNSDDFVVKSD